MGALCQPLRLARLDLIAGQPGGPGWVDGAGAVAHLIDVYTFAGDGTGQLFLSDGDLLRRLDLQSATVTTLLGAFNQPGTADGPAAKARVFEPGGLALSGTTLYLSDTENHTLRLFDLAAGTISTLAGTAETPGTADGTGPAARFREPEGLVLAPSGVLFVADTDNNAIRQLDPKTGQVTTFAGLTGTSGMVDGVGTAARLFNPRGMVQATSGDLFVVDSGNMAIRRVTTPGAQVSTVATFTALPAGVALDGADLIVSLGDDRVVRVATATGTVTTIAGSANQIGFVDGVGAAARFSSPSNLWSDGAGTIYIADNGNVAIRTLALASGTVATLAGASSKGSSDGATTASRFSGPTGLIADAAGNLYVADSGNHTLRFIDRAVGAVTTLAGSAGQPGQNDGLATSARFDVPAGLALDAARGLLYLADTGNQALRRYDLATKMVTTLALAPAAGSPFSALMRPTSLAMVGDRLFVSDGGVQVVWSVSLPSAQVSLLAGKPLVQGARDGVADAARFNSPTGLAADGEDHLYLADQFNHAVRKITISTGAVTTLAGQLSIAGTDDGMGTAARFNYPTQLALTAGGELFVVDSFNHSVRRVDVANGVVTTPIGNPASWGVELGLLPAQLGATTAIALTPRGELALFAENSALVVH
jgi:sugar lactone lactonase YvrE